MWHVAQKTDSFYSLMIPSPATFGLSYAMDDLSSTTAMTVPTTSAISAASTPSPEGRRLHSPALQPSSPGSFAVGLQQPSYGLLSAPPATTTAALQPTSAAIPYIALSWVVKHHFLLLGLQRLILSFVSLIMDQRPFLGDSHATGPAPLVGLSNTTSTISPPIASPPPSCSVLSSPISLDVSPTSQVSRSPPVVLNHHPMVTRLKNGVSKPRFSMNLKIEIVESEPTNFK